MTFLYRTMACAAMALLCLSPLAWAQVPARTLTLADAASATLVHHPALSGFGYRLDALAGERQTAALRPEYRLETSLENIAGSGEFKGTSALEATLSLASVIEWSGQRDARLAVMSAREKQLASAQRQLTLDVLVQLTRQFIRVVESQHHLSLQQEALSLAQATLNTINRQVDAGRLSDMEQLRARALLAQAELDMQAARQALHGERLKLVAFWGKTTADVGEARADLFAFSTLAPLPALLERLAANPDLAVLADETAVQQAALYQARREGRPELAWSAGVRRLQDTGDSALVFGLSLPLGSEGRNRGAVATATAQEAEARWREDTVRLQLAAQLQANVSAREQSLHEVNRLRDHIIPLLTQVTDAANKAFQQGRYSHLELNLAQRDLLDARRRLITAAADTQLLDTDIDRLLGVSPAADINGAAEKVLP